MVPVGVVCVSVAPIAAMVVLLFLTVSVYVIFAPGATVVGAAVSVTERSGMETVVVVVAVLFAGVGSVPVSPTVTVSEMVEPDVTVELTWTTTVNVEEALAAKVAAVHEMFPVPPTEGSVPQVQPVGMVIDW